MGMLASYQAVDDAALASTMDLDEDDLIELIEEFYDDDDVPGYDMDKNWDMLHFVLTGASASWPIDGDPLSQAIVGVHVYGEESYYSSTQADEVPRILDALRAVDIDSLRGRCDPAAFRKHDLYPALEDAPEDSLWQTMKDEYEGLLGFYSEAGRRHLNVIVSIY